jgi:hypothetical protein
LPRSAGGCGARADSRSSPTGRGNVRLSASGAPGPADSMSDSKASTSRCRHGRQERAASTWLEASGGEVTLQSCPAGKQLPRVTLPPRHLSRVRCSRVGGGRWGLHGRGQATSRAVPVGSRHGPRLRACERRTSTQPCRAGTQHGGGGSGLGKAAISEGARGLQHLVEPPPCPHLVQARAGVGLQASGLAAAASAGAGRPAAGHLWRCWELPGAP